MKSFISALLGKKKSDETEWTKIDHDQVRLIK